MSSIADIRAEIYANAGYESTGSIDEAKAYRTALERLKLLQPSRAEAGNSVAAFSTATIEDSLKRVSLWLARYGSGSKEHMKTRVMSFRNSRDT